jgi:hypothetical protein
MKGMTVAATTHSELSFFFPLLLLQRCLGGEGGLIYQLGRLRNPPPQPSLSLLHNNNPLKGSAAPLSSSSAMRKHTLETRFSLFFAAAVFGNDISRFFFPCNGLRVFPT